VGSKADRRRPGTPLDSWSRTRKRTPVGTGRAADRRTVDVRSRRVPGTGKPSSKRSELGRRVERVRGVVLRCVRAPVRDASQPAGRGSSRATRGTCGVAGTCAPSGSGRLATTAHTTSPKPLRSGKRTPARSPEVTSRVTGPEPARCNADSSAARWGEARSGPREEAVGGDSRSRLLSERP